MAFPEEGEVVEVGGDGLEGETFGWGRGGGVGVGVGGEGMAGLLLRGLGWVKSIWEALKRHFRFRVEEQYQPTIQHPTHQGPLLSSRTHLHRTRIPHPPNRCVPPPPNIPTLHAVIRAPLPDLRDEVVDLPPPDGAYQPEAAEGEVAAVEGGAVEGEGEGVEVEVGVGVGGVFC